MSHIASQHKCIATVTTSSFVVGTIVMLDSFFHHNGWFKGDIVVIHNKLPAEQKQQLRSRFPNIIFYQVSLELSGAVEQAHFYALETIKLSNYQRVLFCDSDLLFRGSIEPLFEKDHKLICCGDGIYYQGGGRERESFDQKHLIDPSSLSIIANTFNSGMMLFDQSILNESTYQKALAQLSPHHQKVSRAGHTDQMVFNRIYEGQQYITSAEYNYLMTHRNVIFNQSGVTIDKAKVLHFNGRAKPWLAAHVLHKTLQDPAYIKAVKYWQAAYIDCLQRLHLTVIHSLH